METVVLEGSPNKKGSSNMLAAEFIRGAREAGHVVEIIDAAHANLHPCTGCVRCGYEGPCVQKDDMEKFRKQILEADMMVFVTPLYYYGMSAQLKVLLDRFCAINSSITRKNMKSAMISAAWNSDSWTFEALAAHYQTLVRYLNLQDMGTIWGKGCGTPSMTTHSPHPKLAYELGQKLR
ncbi:MAG TPA: flavodoxin family protein [Candidatus Blautia excrementigallinarum]|nr:flavodoxin family protein [Candidatus Blautia excrementigallinarum]